MLVKKIKIAKKLNENMPIILRICRLSIDHEKL